MVKWGVQLVASEPPRAPGYYTTEHVEVVKPGVSNPEPMPIHERMTSLYSHQIGILDKGTHSRRRQPLNCVEETMEVQ